MPPRVAHLVVPRQAAGDDRAAVVEANSALVIVVADGAGGTAGGAVAAEAVVAAVVQHADALVAGAIDPAALLARIDGELARRRDAGQTTAIVVVVRDPGVVGASVGDSEAWLIGDDEIVDLSANQRRKPLLGAGDASPVGFATGPITGTLVLGSDGLFKYARRDRIVAALRDGALGDAPARLVELARLPAGALQDDVAVIVCPIRAC